MVSPPLWGRGVDGTYACERRSTGSSVPGLLWFSRELLRREHAELEALRLKLHPKSRDDVLHAFATVWQMVDGVYRVRELAQSVPGLNRRDVQVRLFLEATAIADQFRHYVQHLRGEFTKKDPNRFPVWGSLGWVDASDESASHVAVTGSVPAGTELASAVFDRAENRWVSRVPSRSAVRYSMSIPYSKRPARSVTTSSASSRACSHHFRPSTTS